MPQGVPWVPGSCASHQAGNIKGPEVMQHPGPNIINLGFRFTPSVTTVYFARCIGQPENTTARRRLSSPDFPDKLTLKIGKCKEEVPKMTKNQERFIAEYLIDRNATRAYRAAYPNAKSESAIRANASRLIAKANIRAAIQEGQAAAIQRAKLDADSVLQALQAIAFDQSGGKAPSTRDRLYALQLLGRALHLWEDSTGPQDVTVTFRDLDGCEN